MKKAHGKSPDWVYSTLVVTFPDIGLAARLLVSAFWEQESYAWRMCDDLASQLLQVDDWWNACHSVECELQWAFWITHHTWIATSSVITWKHNSIHLSERNAMTWEMSLLHPWCWNRADVKIRGANSSPEVAKAIITRELLERLYLHAQRLPVGAAWQCHSSGPSKFEIDPLLPALSTDPRLISYGFKFQTLRPSDPQTLVFLSLKNVTVNQSVYVCIYIYIYTYLYIWYIWYLKKKHPNVDTMYCWVPVGIGPKVSRSKELRRTPSGITYGFPSAVVLRRRLFCIFWWNLLGKKSWRKR